MLGGGLSVLPQAEMIIEKPKTANNPLNSNWNSSSLSSCCHASELLLSRSPEKTLTSVEAADCSGFAAEC